ncbi:MAG: DUF892 family protein [Bacteroidia bacterium]
MRTENLYERENGRPAVITSEPVDPSALRGLFRAELYDIYWAEKDLAVLLTKLADKVSSEELADAILDDLTMCYTHIDRLDDAFFRLQEKQKGRGCEVMKQLFAEAERILSLDTPGVPMDAAVFSLIRRIRYSQITSYGIICSFLRALGEIGLLSVMETSLEDERLAYGNLMRCSAMLLNA